MDGRRRLNPPCLFTVKFGVSSLHWTFHYKTFIHVWNLYIGQILWKTCLARESTVHSFIIFLQPITVHLEMERLTSAAEAYSYLYSQHNSYIAALKMPQLTR